MTDIGYLPTAQWTLLQKPCAIWAISSTFTCTTVVLRWNVRRATAACCSMRIFQKNQFQVKKSRKSRRACTASAQNLKSQRSACHAFRSRFEQICLLERRVYAIGWMHMPHMPPLTSPWEVQGQLSIESSPRMPWLLHCKQGHLHRLGWMSWSTSTNGRDMNRHTENI